MFFISLDVNARNILKIKINNILDSLSSKVYLSLTCAHLTCISVTQETCREITIYNNRVDDVMYQTETISSSENTRYTVHQLIYFKPYGRKKAQFLLRCLSQWLYSGCSSGILMRELLLLLSNCPYIIPLNVKKKLYFLWQKKIKETYWSSICPCLLVAHKVLSHG